LPPDPQFCTSPEGDDLIAFDLLVSVEADVVAALFRRRRRAIAMDDGHIEKAGLTKLQHHDCENDVKAAAGLPPSKSAINPAVANLGAPFRVLCSGQFLPLTTQVQQFRDVIEQGMQGQPRRRAPASNGQVGQDKLPEPLQAQFCRYAPGLHSFPHFDPQKKREPVSNQAISPNLCNFITLPENPTSLETCNQ
jgi:hypothetical protein